MSKLLHTIIRYICLFIVSLIVTFLYLKKSKNFLISGIITCIVIIAVAITLEYIQMAYTKDTTISESCNVNTNKSKQNKIVENKKKRNNKKNNNLDNDETISDSENIDYYRNITSVKKDTENNAIQKENINKTPNIEKLEEYEKSENIEKSEDVSKVAEDTSNVTEDIPIKHSKINQPGYYYAHPDTWNPPCAKPPKCITNNKCEVQPIIMGAHYAEYLKYDKNGNTVP